MSRTLVLALLVLLPAMAGCLGGDARSEWAYQATGLAAASGLGRTGEGVKVGVLDTGINVGHPSLDHLVDGSRSNGELLGFQDYIRNRGGIAEAYDDIGHGSHVVGIMSARGSSFSDKLIYGGIDLHGGSPSILLYVAKVCGASDCPADGLVRALDWMASQDVDVVSLSLGGLRNPLAFNDQTRNRINGLIDAGVVVVAAAGNSGPGVDEEDRRDDVDAPADIEGVVAVGAIDQERRVASISSRGDNGGLNQCRSVFLGGSVGRCDPHKKPELVAPGVDILSAWMEESYTRATGTSQAAPFVTSVVALMLEGRPDVAGRAGVYQIKQVLMDTAAPLQGQATPHDPAAGYGLVQAVAAIEAYGGA